jgi:starch phosphorylase
VRVELYADGIDGAPPVRQEMKRISQQAGVTTVQVYGANVPSARPAADYTARLMPRFKGLAIPLEAANVLWQR